MAAHESWHVNDPLDKRCPHAEPQADSQLHGVCVFCWRDRAGAIRAHLTTENEALKKELEETRGRLKRLDDEGILPLLNTLLLRAESGIQSFPDEIADAKKRYQAALEGKKGET